MTNDAERPSDEGAHPAGVWRALAIFTLAAAFAWIPYVVPGLETLRVLGPKDDAPLANLISFEPQPGGGLFRRTRPAPRDVDALLERAPLPPPIAIAPRPSAPRPADSEARFQTPLPRIEPEALEGLTREIEDPHGAMRSFYRQLARVARDEPVLARMSVYGTSINGTDRMTSQLRGLLQDRFGDGGKGWVPISPGWQYQGHQDVAWRHEHWRTFVVNRSNGPLDRYGFGGVLAVNRNRRAFASVGTVRGDGPGSAVSVFRLFYQAWPEGGQLSLSVDEGAPRLVSTRAAEVEDRVETIEVPDGAHTLSVRAVGGDGDEAGREDLRLYGFTMERAGPGVVVDGLGLVGAFTRVLRLFDDEHITTQIRQRDTNLLVFWMGANDVASESVPYIHDEYVAHYRGIIRHFTDSRPDTSCLVMSVLDKGENVDGAIRTRRRVPGFVEAQREVAMAEGCAFFNAYEATGGSGTMRRWYRARPRLVTADLGHLTAAGSRVIGTLFHRALLKGYDDWIADGEPAPEP